MMPTPSAQVGSPTRNSSSATSICGSESEPFFFYFVAALGDRVPAVSPGKIAEAQPEPENLQAITQEDLLTVLEAGTLVLPVSWEARLARWAGGRQVSIIRRLDVPAHNRAKRHSSASASCGAKRGLSLGA